MLCLKELIEYMSLDTNVKICVHDVSGILMNEKLEIPEENKIHFCDFCNTAKSTPTGYRLCIACKSLANKKAILEQKPFDGRCPWGIFEAVYPVVIKDAVQCIVYVGNAVTDRGVFEKRSARARKITGVDENAVCAAYSSCETAENEEKLRQTAKITGDFIALLSDFYMYEKQPKMSVENRMSKIIGEYVKLNYRQPITLAALSKIYFINEKYLGRILKKAWGMSFHRYLNSVRLHNAAKMLRTEERTVTDIALDCGFETVTYFNRLFRQNFGKTPSEYRREYKK